MFWDTACLFGWLNNLFYRPEFKRAIFSLSVNLATGSANFYKMAIFKLVSFFAPLTVCAELASTPWPLIAELDTENFDRHIGVEKRYLCVQMFSRFQHANSYVINCPEGLI